MRARKHNGLRISFLRNMSNFAFKGKKIYASILYIVSVYLKFEEKGGFFGGYLSISVGIFWKCRNMINFLLRFSLSRHAPLAACLQSVFTVSNVF